MVVENFQNLYGANASPSNNGKVGESSGHIFKNIKMEGLALLKEKPWARVALVATIIGICCIIGGAILTPFTLGAGLPILIAGLVLVATGTAGGVFLYKHNKHTKNVSYNKPTLDKESITQIHPKAPSEAPTGHSAMTTEAIDHKPEATAHKIQVNTDFSTINTVDIMVESGQKMCTHQPSEQLQKKQNRNLDFDLERLVGHICGGSFLASSKLEGMEQEQAYTYLLDYLRNDREGVPEELSQQLADCLTISDLQNGKAGEKIRHAFDSQTPLLLMGGWTGKPHGHAIYYEILPESPNSSSFRLYEVGAGSNYHRRAKLGGKIKAQTFCEWQGVAKDKLLSPQFLQVMHELSSAVIIPNSENRLTDYDEKDIYEGLKGILQPKKEQLVAQPSESDEALMMSIQRSGTCSWKSLMAFMRTKMNPTDYKRLKTGIKIKVLADYVSLLSQEGSPPSARQWHLVKASHQKLCRTLVQYKEQSIITDDFILKTNKQLKDVSDWIHKESNCRFYKDEINTFQYAECGNVDKLKKIVPEESFLERHAETQQVVGQQPCTYLASEIQTIIKSSKPLRDKLATLLPLCQRSWQIGEDVALHSGILKFITELNIDKEFWKKELEQYEPSQRSEVAGHLIKQLGDLSDLFFKSCFTIPEAHILFPEKTYVISKTLFLQQQLCHLGFPNTQWAELQVKQCPEIFKENKTFDNYQMQKDMQIICESNKINSKAILPNLFCSDSRELLIKFPRDCEDKRIKYFEQIIREECKDVVKQVSHNEKTFAASSTAVQDSMIYSSDLLPDWIKALRDTSHLCSYLTIDYPYPVGLLTELNRETSLKQEYREEKSPWQSEQEKKDTRTLKIGFVDLNNNCKPELLLDECQCYKGVKIEPVNSEIKRFIGFLPNVIESTTNTQEKELQSFYNSIRVSEEMKELGYAIGIRSDIQLFNLLDFFSLHSEKLLDVDYQSLFYDVLFSRGLLEKSLPHAEALLSKFLEMQYTNMKGQGQALGALFLLRAAHKLSIFFPDKNHFNSQFFKNTIPELEILLSRANVDEKANISAEIAAQLADKEQLSTEEIALLLSSTLYVKQSQTTSKQSIDPTTLKEVNTAMTTHAKRIRNALVMENQPNQILLNAIFKQFYPLETDKLWQMQAEEGQFPKFFVPEGEFLFLPLEALLLSAEKSSILLPASIRQNAQFLQLFPHVESGNYIGNNRYSFIDANSDKNIVYLNDKGKLVVERHTAEGRFFLLSTSSFLEEKNGRISSILNSRTLVQPPNFWWYSPELSEKGLYFQSFDKESNKPSMTLQVDDNKLTLTRHKDGLVLGKPSRMLQNFEDPSYIHEWYGPQDKLEALELPRFNLSFFTKDGDTKKLFCKEYPDYYIDNSSYKSLEPQVKLGGHSHFLLLKHPDKPSKVLLPQQTFKSAGVKESLLPLYQIERELNNPAQNYYEYEIGKQGELKSKSREANLYLAQILSMGREYKKAASYLKKYGEKLSNYSEWEEKSLKSITDIANITGDISGNAIALQLYAQYLLIHNDFFHNRKVSIGNLQDLYGQYLSQYGNITVFKLKKEEEEFIRSFLQITSADGFFAPYIPAATASEKLHLDEDLRTYIGKWIYDPQKPTDQLLITRAAHEIKNNFIYYYKQVRGCRDPVQIENWHAIIAFLKVQDANSIAALFEALLQAPDSFPEAINLDKNNTSLQDVQDWLKNLAEMFEIHQHKKIKQKESPISPLAPLISMPLPISEKSLQGDDNASVIAKSVIPLHYICKEPLPLASRCQKFFKAEGPPEVKEENKGLLDCIQSSMPATNNFLYQNELGRLEQDICAYQKQKKPPIYSLEGNLPGIKNFLLQEGVSEKGLKQLREELLALANKEPTDELELAQKNLQKWGGIRKKLTEDELLINFVQQNPQAISLRNPALTSEEINTLYQKIGEYLLLATQDQQQKRALTLINQLENFDATALNPCPLFAEPEASSEQPRADRSQEKRELINQLAEELLAQRAFVPSEHPAYLVFEYYEALMMRPAQCEKLDRFLKGDDSNIVMEMIMGSGKSKVLLPLLGLLRADGKNLSMLIVPEPLFESVAKDAQSSLQRSFGQSLRTLKFDRESSFSESSLKIILSHLNNIQDQRECLIMTSKSMQCLILKFVEASCSYYSSDNAPTSSKSTELQLLREILQKLSSSGYPLIDEADSVLKVFHQVCFSTKKGPAPLPEEIELIAEIYKLLHSEEMKKLVRLEYDTAPDHAAPTFTEQYYRENVQNALAEALIKRFSVMSFDSVLVAEKMKKFISGMSTVQQKLLKQYLCRQNIQEAQKFYNEIADKDIQNLLALAGVQIANFLPDALSRNCDEKYGIWPGERIAIPFAAATQPSLGSQFANPHITMNYTFQAYLKNGIPSELIENAIQKLHKTCLTQMQEGSKNLLIKETKAWQDFRQLVGENSHMPITGYSKQELEAAIGYINSNAELKINFVCRYILPDLRLFAEKISCNPHNLISFFQKVLGFTGSLWNGMSMHHTLTTERAMGTEAKTLSLLWEHSRLTTLNIKEGSLEGMLEQLKGTDYDMLCDTGGYFKMASNEQVANAVQAMKDKPVAFYSDKGEQMVTDEKKVIPLGQMDKLSPAERLTFLDQSHTTGADIPQKRDALSLVTIGRNILLRDLLQSVWRLRGLDKGQRVRFVVSQKVAEVIRQQLKLQVNHDIQFEEILRFAIANQIKQQAKDNYEALSQELKNIPQMILLKALMRNDIDADKREELFKLLPTMWREPGYQGAKELYGTITSEIETHKALEQQLAASRKQIEQIFLAAPWLGQNEWSENNYLTLAESIIDRLKDSLAPSILGKENAGEQTLEIEQEQETETQAQTETETETMTKSSLKFADLRNGIIKPKDAKLQPYTCFLEAKQACSDKDESQIDHIPTFSLHSYLEQDDELKEYAKDFKGIDSTINVLNWISHEFLKSNPYFKNSDNSFRLLDGNVTPFKYLYLQDDKAIMLSHYESAARQNNPHLYNITLGYLDDKQQVTEQQMLKIIKIKFLRGESSYTKQEFAILTQWLEQAGKEKMRKLYLNHILKGSAEKFAAYRSSNLYSFFQV